MAASVDAPVQRGALDDIASAVGGAASTVAEAVLPKWVTDIAVTMPSQARSMGLDLERQGKQGAAGAQAASQQVGGQAKGASQAAVAAGQQESSAVQERTAVEVASAERAGEAASRTGQDSSGKVGALGSLADRLLNPVGPMVSVPAVEAGVGRAVDIVGSLPGGLADLGGGLKDAVTAGLAEGDSSGWDCDQAEVMSMVGGVGRAVTSSAVAATKKVVGAGRYEALAAWAEQKKQAIKKTATQLKAVVGRIATKIKALWSQHVAPLVQKLEGHLQKAAKVWEEIKAKVSKRVDRAIEVAKKAWEAIKTKVIDPIVVLASGVKDAVAGLFNKAKTAVGSWWSKLPGWAQTAITGIGAVAVGPVGVVLAGAYKAGEALAGHRDGIVAWAKAQLDKVLPALARGYNKLKERVSEGLKKLKAWGKKAADMARAKAEAAYKWIDEATGGRLSKLAAALAAVKQKISGAACTALGEAAGPCVDQFVPDPGADETADVEVKSNAELTVPVYDVPVKVGQGSSIKISRAGPKSKKYRVTMTGNGLLAVTTPSGGGGGGSTASIDVALPGTAGSAWKALTGKEGPSMEKKSPAPAVAPPSQAKSNAGTGATPPSQAQSPGAAQAPGQGGGGSEPEVGAEAGYKGSVAMTFEFDAAEGKDSTCDGLGGLTALLAAQGIGHALPPPFGTLVAQSSQGSYSENVTSCVFTFAEYGNASVDVKAEGVGGVKAAVSGEAGVSLERSKDDAGKWSDTATLSEGLGVSGSAELAVKGANPLNMSAAAGVTGSLFAKLAYSEDDDKISALSAGAKVAGEVALSRPEILNLLPASVTGPVMDQVNPVIKAAIDGKLGVEAEYSLDNLHELLGKLDSYFAQPEQVKTDGVIEIVKTHFDDPKNVTKNLTVTMSTTNKLAGASVAGEGDGVGVKADVTVEEHRQKVLYKGRL